MHFGGPKGHGDSVEDAVDRITGDKIAGATGADVKPRFDRKHRATGGAASSSALTARRANGDFLPAAARRVLTTIN
jgi:hypothetical protein